MRKMIGIFLCVGLAIGLWLVYLAEAGVVIKVRALNPLDSQEAVLINYPLPVEITRDDILDQKITYSLDHSEDEEPPKSKFQVTFHEEEGSYYIEDEVTLLPREVVTLEVHVKDIWTIDRSRIEALRREVEDLLSAWDLEDDEPGEEGLNDIANGEESLEGNEEEGEESGDAETKETALMMKEEILASLDGIIAGQEANSILNVGVERHISSYNDNIRDLLQVQQDIALLVELMQYSPTEPQEGDVAGNESVGDEELADPGTGDEHADLKAIDLE
jgi:hypothetical protein